MKRIVLIAATALFLLPGVSSAALVALNATINSDQAGTTSGGLGSAAMLYNTDTNVLTWAILFDGLSGGLTVAHFHGPAAPGDTAGIEVDIIANSGGDLSPLIGSAMLSDVQEGDLLNNLWYINLHTAAFPAGEIRGQVTFKKVVPIPAAVWLFGSALMGIGALRRRT
ncbi:MAG: CHRD domain-containing protein [Gammaproteobacteria bacterium]|nr:CHRD domain-containing protein [Gammaproteobacteria bacterium]NNF60453.1 CHRD domain-containing protein [Gammaproteobacteria bacterium]